MGAWTEVVLRAVSQIDVLSNFLLIAFPRVGCRQLDSLASGSRLDAGYLRPWSELKSYVHTFSLQANSGFLVFLLVVKPSFCFRWKRVPLGSATPSLLLS